MMNILFHHPSMGYFLEGYFMIFRETFPSEMKPGECSAKITNKKGRKVKKSGKEKKQNVKIEEAVSHFKPNILKVYPFSPKVQKLQFSTRNRLKPE